MILGRNLSKLLPGSDVAYRVKDWRNCTPAFAKTREERREEIREAQMSALASKLGGCAIGAACVFVNPAAKADIVFCNNFPHLVYVAVAYPQSDGSWVSRGWLNVSTGACSEFDTAVRVKTFYYRGESDPFSDGGRQVKNIWGTDDDTKFAIYEDSNFNYWNAQTKILNSTLVGFIKGVETNEDSLSVTVTFAPDGIHSTQTTHSSAPKSPQ